MKGWRLLGALSALALLSHPAAGQAITNCGGQDGFKVYLDEPSVADDALGDLEFLLNEILFLFEDRKQREWVEWLPQGDSGSVQFVICSDRQPSIDGSDFDSQLTDLLYNDDVLVELVASLREREDSAGERSGIAHLRFVVVPIRQLHFESAGGHDGFFLARLTTGGESADFVELFENVREIDDYVAAGLGVKAARRGDYDAAQRGLCRSLATMAASDATTVVDLLSGLAGENLVAAQADSEYIGALGLLDPTDPCPEIAP